MNYRTMGKLGIQASAFGLGCMRFNGAASGDSIIDEQKAISLIRQATGTMQGAFLVAGLLGLVVAAFAFFLFAPRPSDAATLQAGA